MKQLKFIACLALAIAMPLTAVADDLSWDYADVRYTGYDASGASGDGFGITGVKSIGTSAYLLGAYDDLTVDVLGFDVGVTYWRVGLGTHRAFSDTVTGFSEFTYENVTVEAFGASVDENGFGFRLGLRSMVTDSFELNGGIRYIDAGATDTLLGIGGVLMLGERFALSASYEDGDDSFYTLGARFNFGAD